MAVSSIYKFSVKIKYQFFIVIHQLRISKLNWYLFLLIISATYITQDIEIIYGQDETAFDLIKKQTPWVEFFYEKIEIKCSDSEIQVRGTYNFRSLKKSNITIGIQYPFPVDNFHPFPHDIYIENYTYSKDSANIYFNFSLRPEESKSVTINYRQMLLNKKATYILSTTKSWGQPIQLAEFHISVPVEWKNVILSYKTDNIIFENDRAFYSLRKSNFFPDNDLIISWE